MSSTKISLILIIFLVLPLVFAQDFEIYADSSLDELCPGSTGLFTDIIKNQGSEPLSFTISTSGTASSFSTTVPQGFTLLPDQLKTIYTYVSPRSTTNTGTYSLKLIADSNGVSREMTHNIVVRDCYEYTLEALNTQKNTCPSGTETFEFVLKNNGKFTESYTLSLEGEYTSSVVLSTDKVTLDSGESESVFAYVTSSSDDLGDYDFTVKSTPLNSKSIRTATSTIIVDPCYDFGVSTEKDLVNMCEHSQESIQVTLSNTGSTTNVFSLDVEGPAWANIDKNSVSVSPGSQSTANLILNPDYGVEGRFEIVLNTQPSKGVVKARNTFNVNVKKCHGVSVDIEKSSDKICNSLENTYEIRVRNVGEFSKEYFFSIDGPDWATLDKTTATLDVGDEEQLTLTVNPSFDTPKASYIINVEAIAKDSAKLASSDSIEIETITKDECYQAFLGIEEKKVEVYYDSSATVPIVIENRGTYATTYDMSISGTASNFVYLNPSSITIEAGKSEIVYLYIAPSGQIANGDYSITVSARSGDSAILATEKVDITVSESQFLAPEKEEEPVEEGESIFSRIAAFIVDLFKPDRVEVEEEQVEEVVEEDTEEEIIDDEAEEEEEETEEVIDEPEENVTEEIVEEELLEELDFMNSKLLEGESEEFMLNDEKHTIEVTSADENSIWVTISSDPISLNIEEGGEKRLDLDKDGIYDILILFNGFDSEGKADIYYEKISEPVEVVEEEVVEDDVVEEESEVIEEDVITGDVVAETDESDEESFFGGFFASLGTIGSSIAALKFHIIGLIVIIIVLYVVFKTKSHRKIIEFFEEEIDEEEIAVLDKEQKPVKEKKVETKKETKKPVKKKEVKKKGKKEVTEDTEDELEIKGLKQEEDKEDFIIEFDEEK